MIQGKEDMDIVELQKAQEKEMELAFMDLDLKAIKRWAIKISGKWNGDFPGGGEDRALQANDIIEKVDELIELIKGIEEL